MDNIIHRIRDSVSTVAISGYQRVLFLIPMYEDSEIFSFLNQSTNVVMLR